MVIGWAFYANSGRVSFEKRLFIRGCQVLVCIQFMMTSFFVLEYVYAITQWITWSVPWLFGTVDWFDTEKFGGRVSKPSWHHWILVFIGLGYIWHATPPPWMRDSLTYHLALAKQYAISGAYVETDFVVFSYFPIRMAIYSKRIVHSPLTGEYVFNPRYLSVGICMLTAIGIFGWIKEQTRPKNGLLQEPLSIY